MVVSLIYDKRAIPIYIQILNKQGSSNLAEQKRVLDPVIRLLKNYTIVILGGRGCCSVKLATCLQEQNVGFALRLKKNENVQQDSVFVELSQLGLKPGTSLLRNKKDLAHLILRVNGKETIADGSRMKAGLF